MQHAVCWVPPVCNNACNRRSIKTSPGFKRAGLNLELAPVPYTMGYKNFVRSNPKSDLFPVERFHHIEFWCVTCACDAAAGSRVTSRCLITLSNNSFSTLFYHRAEGTLAFFFLVCVGQVLRARVGILFYSYSHIPSNRVSSPRVRTSAGAGTRRTRRGDSP